MPRKKNTPTSTSTPTAAFTHKDTRKNIPTEELRDFVADDETSPKTMLYPRDPSLDPQLVWKGKDEQDSTDLGVPVVPIYIQEKIHPQALIEDLRREHPSSSGRGAKGEETISLFDDFNGLESFDQKIDFYKHDQHWSNRMILGDSLLTMTSLAEKEGLKGKVQMIYIDPPYGIKFGSNWQVSTRKRSVTDGKAEEATRQPEQIKAFRDTWQMGIHSYLAYLRERLAIARDLLTETGSIFVQIGDENVHLVRCVLDETFGAENFQRIITASKTSTASGEYLPIVADYVLWYSRRKEVAKARMLFAEKVVGGTGGSGLTHVLLPNGVERRLTDTDVGDPSALPKGAMIFGTGDITSSKPPGSFAVEFRGRAYAPGKRYWSSNEIGMRRLVQSDRVRASKSGLSYLRFQNDFNQYPLSNVWTDTVGQNQFGGPKSYVVQTALRIVQRCMLLCTDPGDLVLDPTCGSGTTAYVAEQWGRRWITIDTSRVALALARTRLMAGKFPYYLLSDSREGLEKEAELTGSIPRDFHTEGDIRKGFVYKRVPHVTLKSIANNEEIDTIHEKWQPKQDAAREKLNKALKKKWEEWDVPREEDSSWPEAACVAHKEFWKLRRDRQKEIDASIARRADQETLFDQPYEDNKRVRVTGPFTVESLSPHRVLPTDENMDGEITEHEAERGQDFATMILDNLKKAGVKGTDKGMRISFETLEPYAGQGWINAVGTYTNGDGKTKRAAISIGPEHGTVGPDQVKEAAKEAVQGIGFDILVVLGFAFDPHVSEEAKRYGNLKVLPARMNPDLAMGEELLKKTGAGNLFTVFGEPDVVVRSGLWLVGRGGKVVCEYEWFKELSGLGSLEEINRLGRDDLSGLKEISAGRAVRNDESALKSGSLRAGKHRGESGKDGDGRIPSESERSQRLTGGSGDADNPGQSSGTHGSRDNAETPQPGNRNQQDARRPQASTTSSKSTKKAPALATNHESLDTNPRSLDTNHRSLDTTHSIAAIQSLTANDVPLTTSHQTQVTLHGVDVFDPTTGDIRSDSTDDIACWFIDTEYDGESFFVRHAYFTGAQEPYDKLKRALRADIDEDAWSTLYSTTSRPFPKPTTGKIAVKVINHYGDEVLKVYGV